VSRHARHASADELASLAVGELRTRKAARIESHLTTCEHCTQLRQALDGIPTVLASAHYPPMPATVSIRIEAAIRVEATQRLATMPATEAGRGDLPARHRRPAVQRRWHLPGFSVPATRLVAAGGALALVAFGSYELASHTGNSATTAQSAGSAAGPAQPMNLGPAITYGGPGAQHTIQAVQQNTDYVPDHLASQVSAAVRTAQARHMSTAQPSLGASAYPRAQAGASASIGAPSPGTAGRLSGCINFVAPGRVLLMVDLARYQGAPATIIVAARAATSPAEVWVVGSSCSPVNKDVLAHAVLGGL
jgi:hypothetical protein